MSHLNARTREHYDSLLPCLEKSYIDYRWRSHPLQRLHYLQTRRTLRNALEEYVSRVDSMLEVGCGPGTWTRDCLEHTERLTLLDISREMLREAKSRFVDETALSYVCGDFTSGGIGGANGFDAIVSVRAIEYMSPKRDVARQVGRLLRPGGTFVVVTKNPRWRDARGEAGFENRDSDSIHSDWISWSRLGRLLGEEGMDVVAVRPAAMGSYEAPLSNAVARRACHWMHRFAAGHEMSERIDPLTESYLLVARRAVSDGGR